MFYLIAMEQKQKRDNKRHTHQGHLLQNQDNLLKQNQASY